MGFWEWVAKYALDGLVGGLIGGLVTGAAVWATIRHERAMRLNDQEEATFDVLRRAVAEALEGATVLRDEASKVAPDLRGPAARFAAVLISAESLAPGLDNVLAIEFRRLRNKVLAAAEPTQVVRRDEIVDACDEAFSIASKWLIATPDLAAAEARRDETLAWDDGSFTVTTPSRRSARPPRWRG